MTSPDGEQFVISDLERRDALALLVRACGDGQVTLDEFSRRTDVALSAQSRTDLVAATADLGVAVAPGRVKRRWFVPFGNRVRRGRFVLPEHTSAVVLAGEIHLDLRGATLVGPEPTIKLWVLMGNLRVLAPRGIHVEVDTSSLFGGRTIATYGPSPSPTTPVLRIRMIDVLGAVKVTDDPAIWSPNLASAEVQIVPPSPQTVQPAPAGQSLPLSGPSSLQSPPAGAVPPTLGPPSAGAVPPPPGPAGEVPNPAGPPAEDTGLA